ncbi:unnamed protein product [Mesocestoides corti]|uniref:Vegetative cell wall protein gp1-like n=1 Tax=Mesocestoides corti TaxID=53468 RepID=A0A0R3UBB2_MESCO|nr:unnamed protein product [Mesocestoides corti]
MERGRRCCRLTCHVVEGRYTKTRIGEWENGLAHRLRKCQPNVMGCFLSLAEDIAQILECATQTPTPPLPVGWRTPAAFSPHPSSVTPPQVPDRTYYEQNRPSVCEPTQKQRAPPPPVPRMSSSSAVPPRYSAQTSSGDGGSAKLSASSLNQAPLKPPIPPPVGGGSASSDQRQSTSNGPITSFDIAKHPVSSQSENQYDVPLDSEYTSEASGPPGDGYVSPNYSNEEPSKDTAPPEVPKTGEDPERNVPTEAKDTQANEAKDVAAVVQEAKGQSSTEASRKTSGVDGTEEVKPILRNPGKKEKGRDSSGDLPEFCKVKESLDRKRISVPSMGNAPAESGSERCKSSTPASNSNANENAKPLRQ